MDYMALGVLRTPVAHQTTSTLPPAIDSLVGLYEQQAQECALAMDGVACVRRRQSSVT